MPVTIRKRPALHDLGNSSVHKDDTMSATRFRPFVRSRGVQMMCYLATVLLVVAFSRQGAMTAMTSRTAAVQDEQQPLNHFPISARKLERITVAEDDHEVAPSFLGIRAGAWKPHRALNVPCSRLPRRSRKRATQTARKGLLFVKIPKAGSSTAASINLQVAYNIAEAKRNTTGISQKHCPMTPPRHAMATSLRLAMRARDQSFMWSVIRDPTRRTISAFFHFFVSRRGVDASDESFLRTLPNITGAISNTFSYLSTENPGSKHLTKIPKDRQVYLANKIMAEYDFIAVMERMEESLVVFQLLLGLQTRDILHLNSKKSGSYDDGRFRNRCTLIQKSVLSPNMKEYFYNSSHALAWVDHISVEQAFHRAVNASLDLTIESLGHDRVQAALQIFRKAQKEVTEKCDDPNMFPCSESNAGQPPREKVCLSKDSGCGYSCIHRVADEMGLPKYKYQVQTMSEG